MASCSIFLNTDWIFGGAGTGPGRACAAFMSCFRAGDSFDMVGACGKGFARLMYVCASYEAIDTIKFELSSACRQL